MNRILFFLALILSLVVAGIGSAVAQSNDDCLTCHSDSTLTMTKNGKTTNLYVDSTGFKSSVHSDQSCVDCHAGFDPNNVPHKKNITPVDCNSCHGITFSPDHPAEAAHSSESCYQCHGKHDIQPARAASAGKCLTCHAREKIFSGSHHAEATVGKTVMSCESCHQKAHDIVRAKFLRGTVEDTLCGQCHATVAPEINKGIHKNVFSTGRLTCVTCHSAHGTIISRDEVSQNACFKCHTDKKLFDGVNAYDGQPMTSLVQSYQHSIHAESLKKTGKGATCVDCHGSHLMIPPGDTTSPVNRKNIVATCGKCHADVKAHYLNSSHGQAFVKGLAVAPVCTDCHKEHSIDSISNPASPVSRANEPKICLDCHLHNKEVLKMVGVSPAFLESIKYSVHLVALSNGNLKAATCSDCHGAHDMLPAGNPSSKVFRNNIPATCGQAGCHQNVASKYFDGIHGKSLLDGNSSAPVCTDCHGDHQIFSPTNPASTVSSGHVVQVCSNCHGSLTLTQRYGLPAQSVGSYLDSYHGLATQGGLTTVANCASCHGAHDIKPSSDPASPINKANLAATCGKCHPGADAQFAAAAVHVMPSSGKDPFLFWLSQLYGVLIFTIIGLMLLHNLFDFFKKSKRKLKDRRIGREHMAGPAKLYLRMNLSERVQHWALLISFTLLVFTGFMLKFPDSWWVKLIREIGGGGERVFELRSLIHRVSAVVMIMAAIFHVYYISFTAQGRQFIRDMVPKLKDARDVAQIIKFYLGITNDKPKFERFSYIEKAEYWALVWGTVVMVTTGLILWFDNVSLGLLTKLGLDIATLIHYYEAILATLAIIVWHIYFVIFNPDVYPMNLSWLFGTITEEEMEEEHPLQLERMKREAEETDRIVVENGNGSSEREPDDEREDV